MLSRDFAFIVVLVVGVGVVVGVAGQDYADDNNNSTDLNGNSLNNTDTNVGDEIDIDNGNDNDNENDNDVGGEGILLTGAEKTIKKGGLFATLINQHPSGKGPINPSKSNTTETPMPCCCVANATCSDEAALTVTPLNGTSLNMTSHNETSLDEPNPLEEESGDDEECEPGHSRCCFQSAEEFKLNCN